MSDGSKIEWTDATWTPIKARRTAVTGDRRQTTFVGWHCEHVSEGCRNCYAETMNRRLGTGMDFKPGHRKDIEIFLDEKMLRAPLKWRKPRKVFVCSMTDLFADFVPDTFIDRMFAVMALCPQHTFQILTKRPERMRAYMAAFPTDSHTPDRITDLAFKIGDGVRGYRGSGGLCERPLLNVWLGTSCEDQATANERIPHLLATPAAIRFLSCEPMLGAIDLSQIWPTTGNHWNALTGREWIEGCGSINSRTFQHKPVNWVIVGGESGPNARPMHPDWARSLRDQCAAAGVPFFFKQWGEWGPDDGPPGTGHDRIMEGRARAAWHDGEERSFADSGYDIPAFSGQGEWVYRLGKKKAGRKLDGREHNEFPETAP